MTRRYVTGGRLVVRECDNCAKVEAFAEGRDEPPAWWWADVTLGGPDGGMPAGMLEAHSAACLKASLVRAVDELEAAAAAARKGNARG